MPDLANVSLSSSSSLTLSRCPALKSHDDSQSDSKTTATTNSPVKTSPVKTLVKVCSLYGWDQQQQKGEKEDCNGRRRKRSLVRVPRQRTTKKRSNNGAKSLEDYVRVWRQEKIESGVPPSGCSLPFLVGAKKMVECLLCHGFIHPGEELLCSVHNCHGVYHLICAKERLGVSNPRKFKCPQHACFICKQRTQWRCVRCSIASHDKCAAWPDGVIHLNNQLGRAVCWRHPTDWRQDKKEVFSRLPLPYSEEEFKIDLSWKGLAENREEPPPYVHIRRNVYLVKKKRDDADTDVGCANCSSTCHEDCVCRVQCISCSKACHCSENCTNRPFRKEKKIKIVKTKFCGWGVEAAEPVNKGDFIIEYVGEVIDDALCEKRLWDMKDRGVQNFYMCEIRKDFTIDATFKGNASRFLNHSCDPNCILEKWQVEGETRVGVFAACSIKVREPLTYDYRFVQFGPEVKCHCGAPNCQGYLGTKRKFSKLINLSWAAKRRRSSIARLAM